MVSVMHPNLPFQHRTSQQDQNDWQLYPDPPSDRMAMNPRTMSHEAYDFQTSMAPQDMITGNPLGFEPWAEVPQGFPGQTSSPSIPSAFDEAEYQVPPSNLSVASGPSASSSAAGSPLSHPGQLVPVGEWQQEHNGGLAIVGQSDFYGTEYTAFPPSIEEFQQPPYDLPLKPQPGFDAAPMTLHPHPDMRTMGMPYDNGYHAPPVYPPPSPNTPSSPRPPMQSSYPNHFHPFHTSAFPPPMTDRRQSTFSVLSHEQQSHSGDESVKEKQRCPIPDCGKVFKDLKAHLLTHQNERPEKCPITTCEYHTKGFARKYDAQRHTLTHYRGTMVCPFCAGAGSASEKSFNRADVFKRHLTALHGVEQTPPNSRKKTASSANGTKKVASYAEDVTGKCSTCSATFSNAQEFYEHLDDCVLRIVQQEDPAEAINAKRLAEVENDQSVHQTLEKNHLPTATPSAAPVMGEGDEDDIDMGDEDGDDRQTSKSPMRRTVKTGPANGIQKSKGLTHSRGGVSLPSKGRARKNRRDYPSSWGFDKGQMTMKKRVMAVFDGQRRLAKDDMMLSTEHEVRVKLSDGKSYVTDLDVQTMKRAEGFHQATEEERGPWISDDPTHEDFQAMLRLQQEEQA